MANLKINFCYIVQKRNFEDHNDDEGKIEILGCYNNVEAANKHAKSEAKYLYRNSDKSISQPPEDCSQGSCHTWKVVLHEDGSGADRVMIEVEYVLCKDTYELDEEDSEEEGSAGEEEDGRVEGGLEDEEEGGEEDGEDEEGLHGASNLPTGLPPDSLSGLTFALADTQNPRDSARLRAFISLHGGTQVPLDPENHKIDFAIMGASIESNISRMLQITGVKSISQWAFLSLVESGDLSKQLTLKRSADRDEEDHAKRQKTKGPELGSRAIGIHDLLV